MKKRKFYSLLTAILLVCTLFLSVSLTACKPKNPNPDSGSTSVKATVTGITLDTASVKKSFEYAEAFTYEGLKVTAQMSDKTTKNVDIKDCKISEPDTSRAGKRNVTVSYEGKTAFYQITVAKRVYPDITKEALLAITGENDSVAYRVEAENIDMAVSSVKKQNSATNFVAQAPLDAEITSGNAYLSNYGVKYNYFGYKFTSDKAYEGVTIVLRLAYSGNGTTLSLNNNFALYLNRAETDEGVVGEISMEGYSVSGGTCVWRDLVLRNQTIKEGENTMTFEALSENVPDIDYIDFYVGKRYISSIVEIAEKKEYVKEIEDFDTEKAKTREDVAKAHHLKDGQLFIETVTKESAGKTTSGGKSVGAIAKGSQLSTTLRLAQKATVKITFIAAKVDDYKVKDNWQFSIDGKKLEAVEDVNIKGGNASAGEYWDWIPTVTGVYNLAAGDHLFLVEVTGGDCNVDCVKFEVISFGEYDESGIGVGEHVCTSKCETCGKCKNADCTEDACKEKCECKPEITFDATITGAGTVKVEAENLDTTTWVHQTGVADFTERWNNDFGSGVCAKGLGKGTAITVNVKVEKKCTLALGVVMSHYDSETYDFSNKELKFGDTVLTAVPSGKFGHREASDYWKWVDVSLGKVEVEAGEYVLSANLYAVNIDYFYFTAIDGTVSNAGVTTIAMENLTDVDVKTRPDFVNAGVVAQGSFKVDVTDTASNGKAICGFYDGTVFNVNFLVTEAGTYKISLVGANDADYPISNMTIMLDGKEITVSSGNLKGTTHDGIPAYWDWQTIEISSSALTVGAHKLTIKIISGCPNLDCVKIEAVAASTAE